MAEIHDRIEYHGGILRPKEEGGGFYPDLLDYGDRHVVKAANNLVLRDALLATTGGNIEKGFLFGGFAQAGLPHKKLADDSTSWKVTSENITLIVDPGSMPGNDDQIVKVGVPYGSRARLILLFMQTQAKLTKNPEIIFGKTMRQWVEKLGIAEGGHAIKAVREQALRLAYCRLSFHFSKNNEIKLRNENIVRAASTSKTADKEVYSATLSDAYFEQALEHSVPLDMDAVSELQNNSAALDAYFWLAYRLHVLEKPLFVSWAALFGQFGGGYEGENAFKNFKSVFRKTLLMAQAVYRDAKLEIEPRGLTLYPSKPPIPPAAMVPGFRPLPLAGSRSTTPP